MTDNPNAFKHALDKSAVQLIAANVRCAESSFDDKAFVRTACKGLDKLELKARVNHIVAALHKHLPEDVPDAIAILVRAGKNWDNGGNTSSTGSFPAWPVIEFVGEHGLQHFDTSMEALRKLTRLFSAEFAIRGFIETNQSKALKLLASWTTDSSEHVRRLVSEGTRPRLPWGRRLREFQNDPRPVLKLLEKLKDDESEYVRRSVANNLNDIAKDHPDTVIEVCGRWSKRASPERQWVIKHATRTLVKDGHPEVLLLLGFDPDANVVVEALTVSPRKLKVGEDLTFSFKVRTRTDKPQPVVIDYAIHHVKADGKRTPKVFKLKTLELQPGKPATLTKTHKFRNITTRTYHTGQHVLEIQVNGKSKGSKEFGLTISTS